jgi:hypothetical protein
VTRISGFFAIAEAFRVRGGLASLPAAGGSAGAGATKLSAADRTSEIVIAGHAVRRRTANIAFLHFSYLDSAPSDRARHHGNSKVAVRLPTHAKESSHTVQARSYLAPAERQSPPAQQIPKFLVGGVWEASSRPTALAAVERVYPSGTKDEDGKGGGSVCWQDRRGN